MKNLTSSVKSAALITALLLTTACNGVYRAKSNAGKPPELPGKAEVIVAAGDIACDPLSGSFRNGEGDSVHCQMKATSDLVMLQDPKDVLMLGDSQYENGSAKAYEKSYDTTWGRFKKSTRPVPGNHEYHQPGARDYFHYFGDSAGKPDQGYYSFDVGKWHIIALNSNCSHVACRSGSEQERWLRDDLKNHSDQCTLAYWHAPRFSSGFHGDSAQTAAFWSDLTQAGADVVLSGHDHDYERFAPQDVNGRLDNEHGIRQFVVGTGGKNLRGSARGLPWHRNHNSEVRQGITFGVLRLDLYPNGYSWKYIAQNPKLFTDEGAAMCHNAQQPK